MTPYRVSVYDEATQTWVSKDIYLQWSWLWRHGLDPVAQVREAVSRGEKAEVAAARIANEINAAIDGGQAPRQGSRCFQPVEADRVSAHDVRRVAADLRYVAVVIMNLTCQAATRAYRTL